MAVIETKYSIGDAVYFAATTTQAKQHPCPDCNGSKRWAAISPAGGEYSFACPRCSASYNSRDDLNLRYTAHVPSVKRMTIGSIQYNTALGAWDNGARYMCVETGVGSGSVYDEARLFRAEDEALAAAEALATEANRTTPYIVKQYDRALEISDYQLDSAALKKAKEASSEAGAMLWNLNDLFDQIDEASDKDAILEAVADYKAYSFERDLEKVAAHIASLSRQNEEKANG